MGIFLFVYSDNCGAIPLKGLHHIMENKELKKLIEDVAKQMAYAHKDVLTSKEVCEYLGIKPCTLYEMTRKKQIPHYKPNGGSLYFKRVEVDEWATRNRIASNAELESNAVAYCM